MSRQPTKSIPRDAKKVFSGEIFDVYQWEQELYDGSSATFEMLARPDTCIVIPVIDNKLLIEFQSQPGEENLWTFPGGRQDDPETPLEAVKRELLEETGYNSDDWELWYSENPYVKIDWNIYIYIARDCQKVAEPTPDAGEKIETSLITLDALIDLAEGPGFRGKGQLQTLLLKAKYDTQEKERLFKIIFG